MPTEWIRRTFCIEKKRKKMLGYRRSQLRNERQKKRERGTERGREEVGDKRLNKSLSAKNVWCSSWLLRCIQRGNGREYFEEKQIMVQKFNEPYYVRRFGFPRFFLHALRQSRRFHVAHNVFAANLKSCALRVEYLICRARWWTYENISRGLISKNRSKIRKKLLQFLGNVMRTHIAPQAMKFSLKTLFFLTASTRKSKNVKYTNGTERTHMHAYNLPFTENGSFVRPGKSGSG